MKSIIRAMFFTCSLLGVFLTSMAQAQETDIRLEGTMKYHVRFIVSARGTTVTSSTASVDKLVNYNRDYTSDPMTVSLLLMKKCYSPKAKHQSAYYIASEKVGTIDPFTYVPGISLRGGRMAVRPGTYRVVMQAHSSAGVYSSVCFKKPLRLSR